MEIKKFVTENVAKDGKVSSGGAVVTEGRISMSRGEGCGLPNCNCSNGYWISIIAPRTLDGKVEGMTAQFKDEEEMNKFFRKHQLGERS